MDISKAIPVWAVGTAITLGGMMTAYVSAQDEKLAAEIRRNTESNHKQDIAVRELQIRMDQMIVEQQSTNTKLDKIVESMERLTVQIRRNDNR